MRQRSALHSVGQHHHRSIDAMIRAAHGDMSPETASRLCGTLDRSHRTLRQQWLEDIIRDAYDPVAPAERLSTHGRTGTITYRNGATSQSPGAWFKVTKREVQAARYAALRCGVTFSTWMHWHLLRRNYEADPNVRRGPFKRVKRGDGAKLSAALYLSFNRPGMSLVQLADQIDDLDQPLTETQRHIRAEIGAIFSDMCRPLMPKRSRRRLARTREVHVHDRD